MGNIIRLFFKMIGHVPPKHARRISRWLGRVLFYVDQKHRKIVLDNLARALGKENTCFERKKIAFRVFQNLFLILFEIGWVMDLPLDALKKYFRLEGLTHLQAAYEKGRGVIVLTAHFGNWELLTIAGKMFEYPMGMVYRPLDMKSLDRFFVQLRTRFGGRLIPAKRALRKLLKGLNNGEIIGMLMDQNVDWYEGFFVDFFGHRACTNSGMALLAYKTKAPVVPVFLIREENGFTAKIFPEIPPVHTGDKRKDLELNTERYNAAIEKIVRDYPDQWFWVHQRWKTKPFCLLETRKRKRQGKCWNFFRSEL